MEAPSRLPRRRTGRRGAAIGRLGRRLVPSAPVTPTVKQGEFALEPADHHLGRIALLPALVGPFTGLQGTLDIDLGALLEVPLGHVGNPVVEDDDPVPFGFSLRSPLWRSFQVSEVARLIVTIFEPSWACRTSGSRPRLPIRMTLLTLPAMAFSPMNSTGNVLRRPRQVKHFR